MTRSTEGRSDGVAPPADRSAGWKNVAGPPILSHLAWIVGIEDWSRYWDGSQWVGKTVSGDNQNVIDGVSPAPMMGIEKPGGTDVSSGVPSPPSSNASAPTITYSESSKNPGVAYVLSAVIPGLGQLYMERVGTGVVLVLLGDLMLYQGYLTPHSMYAPLANVFAWICRIGYPIVWGYAMYALVTSVAGQRLTSTRA